MKPRTIVPLLGLFFLGLIALWWADRSGVPTGDERRRLSGLVLPELAGFDPADARRVEIDGGERPLAFERREDGSWWMTKPTEALADRSKLDALAANLKGLLKSPDAGTLSGPSKPYGLERPERTIRLFGAGPEPLATLDLGATSGAFRYVRPGGGSGIEVVDARRLDAVDLAADRWRERGLFAASPFEVETIEVKGQGGEWSARRRDGRWRLERPIQAPGDEQKLEGLLADLAALRAADGPGGFVADDAADLKPFGLDPPIATIRLTTESAPGRPQVVHLGGAVAGAEGRIHARRGDDRDVLAVPDRVVATLAAEPQTLRSRNVADVRPEDVGRIRIQAGEIEHVIERTSEGWRVLKPEPGRADRQAVQGLIKSLVELRADDRLDPTKVADAGLDSPTLVVEVWEADHAEGPTALRLSIGRHDTKARRVYARAEGDPAVLALPESALSLRPDGPLAFHDRAIQALDRGRIARLRAVRDGRSVTAAAPAEGGNFNQWRVVEPLPAPADGNAIAKMVLVLANLRAERLVAVAGDDLGTYGLDHPSIRVSWASGASSEFDGTLRIGGSVPDRKGSRYAKLEGKSMVFTLNAQAVEVFDAELRDPVLFRFAPEQVGRVILRWPGKAISLSRQPAAIGAGATWEPDPNYVTAGLDLSRVEPLLAELAGLRASRFLQHSGPFPADSGLGEPEFAVELQLKGGLPSRHVRIGSKRSDGGRYATTETGPGGAVFLVTDEDWGHWINAFSR